MKFFLVIFLVTTSNICSAQTYATRELQFNDQSGWGFRITPFTDFKYWGYISLEGVRKVRKHDWFLGLQTKYYHFKEAPVSVNYSRVFIGSYAGYRLYPFENRRRFKLFFQGSLRYWQLLTQHNLSFMPGFGIQYNLNTRWSMEANLNMGYGIVYYANSELYKTNISTRFTRSANLITIGYLIPAKAKPPKCHECPGNK